MKKYLGLTRKKIVNFGLYLHFGSNTWINPLKLQINVSRKHWIQIEANYTLDTAPQIKE
jgi:hypothetical protein